MSSSTWVSGQRPAAGAGPPELEAGSQALVAHPMPPCGPRRHCACRRRPRGLAPWPTLRRVAPQLQTPKTRVHREGRYGKPTGMETCLQRRHDRRPPRTEDIFDIQDGLYFHDVRDSTAGSLHDDLHRCRTPDARSESAPGVRGLTCTGRACAIIPARPPASGHQREAPRADGAPEDGDQVIASPRTRLWAYQAPRSETTTITRTAAGNRQGQSRRPFPLARNPGKAI